MPTPSKTDLNPVQVVGTHRIKPSRGAAKTWLGITCRTGALLQGYAGSETGGGGAPRYERRSRAKGCSLAGGRSRGGLGMVCGIFGVASTQGTAAAHNSSWALARERNKRARDFFYFYIIIFRFIKNIYLFFFKFVTMPPVYPVGTKYRQMNRR